MCNFCAGRVKEEVAHRQEVVYNVFIRRVFVTAIALYLVPFVCIAINQCYALCIKRQLTGWCLREKEGEKTKQMWMATFKGFMLEDLKKPDINRHNWSDAKHRK